MRDELETSNQKLFSVITGIMDAVHSALVITDRDCNILFKNKQADQLIKSISKEFLTNLSSKVNSYNKVFSTDLSLQTAKSELIQLNCTVSSVDGQDLLAWSFLDITREKAAERVAELQAQKAQHAQKMASVGEMSAAIVHEIRNPLTIITGQISLAQEYLDRGRMSEEFIQKLIHRIEKSSSRITGIIKSLLNLSRNTGNDDMKSYFLNEILEEVGVFASLKIKGSKVPHTIELPKKNLKIFCHPSEVTQVLINLVKNAKEEILGQDNPWVKISVEDSDEAVRILVTDSGKGIPDEVADRIFDPYFTTKAVGEGTGIGLSFCKRLIEEGHKGRFYLNKDHPNTQFVVEIPKPKK